MWQPNLASRLRTWESRRPAEPLQFTFSTARTTASASFADAEALFATGIVKEGTRTEVRSVQRVQRHQGGGAVVRPDVDDRPQGPQDPRQRDQSGAHRDAGDGRP